MEKQIALFVNNCRADIRGFENLIWDCAKKGEPLPEELQDCFKLEVREVVSSKTNLPELRAFLDFA